MSLPSYTVPVKGTVSWQSLETRFSELYPWFSKFSMLKSSYEIFETFWKIIEGFREIFETKFLSFESWKQRNFRMVIFLTFLIKASSKFSLCCTVLCSVFLNMWTCPELKLMFWTFFVRGPNRCGINYLLCMLALENYFISYYRKLFHKLQYFQKLVNNYFATLWLLRPTVLVVFYFSL